MYYRTDGIFQGEEVDEQGNKEVDLRDVGDQKNDKGLKTEKDLHYINRKI